MKDFRGEELRGGDEVVYARRQGSSLWFEEGTVYAGPDGYDGKLRVRNTKTGRVVCIQVLDHVIKVNPKTVPFLGVPAVSIDETFV